MRFVSVFSLACALLVASTGASARRAGQTPPAEVVVVGFEWHPQHRNERVSNHSLERRGDYAHNDPANPDRMPRGTNRPNRDTQRLSLPEGAARRTTRVFYGYESSVHLKNAGAKTIEAVEWEHVFFRDEARQEELRRFRVRGEAKVEPGAQRFVAGRGREQKYTSLPARPRQAVELKRIEYSDGSVWESR